MSVMERFPLPEIPPDPELHYLDEFEGEICEQINLMNNRIHNAFRQGDTSPRTLVSIANNLDPVESYVKHVSILRLFEQKGLLEEYWLSGQAFSETARGWQIELRSPIPTTRRYEEQYRFVSTEIEDSKTNTTHRFNLWFQLVEV